MVRRAWCTGSLAALRTATPIVTPVTRCGARATGEDDYGLARVLQMLWRLNFLVIMLMLTMNNTYILYYICPLHTFFFGMVYVTMRIGRSANYSQVGRRRRRAARARRLCSSPARHAAPPVARSLAARRRAPPPPPPSPRHPSPARASARARIRR